MTNIDMESVFRIGKQGSVLPAGYTQLEYIESTGTQYIDTGYIWTSDNASVETEIYRTEEVTAGHGIYGSQKGTHHGLTLYKFGSSSANSYGAQFGESGTTILKSLPLQSWLTIVQSIDSNTLRFSINQIEDSMSAQKTLEKTNSVYLFTSHYNTGADGYAKIRCKYFRLIDNSAIVRNLIPAKRNSDNIVGMFDLVTNTLFTNAGSDSFTAGPVVEVTKISQNNNVIWERAIPLATSKNDEITFRSTRNKSKNLIDSSIFKAGYISLNSSEPALSEYTITEPTMGSNHICLPFEVQAGQTISIKYFVNNFNGIGYAIYENGVQVERNGQVAGLSITPGHSGKMYIWNGLVSSSTESQKNKIMVVKSSTAPTSYQPYWNTLPELNAYGGTEQPSAIKPYVKTALSMTPVSFNSEKEGALNVTVNGKTEKRKRPELWSQYLPIQTLNPATYPMKVENLCVPYIGTVDGLTRELTIDGRIHVSGTCTRTTSGFGIGSYVLPAGTYTLQCTVTGNAGSITTITFNSLSGLPLGETRTVDKSVDVNSSAGIPITLGTTYDFYISPMIVEGSVASPIYTPYGQKLIAVQDIGLDGTKTGTYGYFNTATNEFTEVSGMTGNALSQINYIEGTGSQYILPNLTGNVKWKIVAEGITKTAQQVLASSSQSGADGTWIGEIGSTGKWGIGDNVASTVDVSTKAELEIDFTSTTQNGMINGELIAHPTSAVHNTWALMGTSTGNYCFTGKLFSAQAEVNGELVRDYIPIQAGGVYCLLDKINWEIIGSASGTGFNGSSAVIIPDDIVSNNGVIKYGQYGKNLFDKTKYNQASSWIGTNYKYVEIPLPNGTYTIHWDITRASSNIYLLLQVDGSVKGTSTAGTGGTWLYHADISSLQKDTFTFTVTEGYVYLTCSYAGNFSVLANIVDTIQIEKGSTATSYEPYHFGLHVEGTQEKVITASNCGVVDLGTLNWTYQSGYQYFNSTSLTGIIKNTSNWAEIAHLYCSLYTATNPDDIYGSSGSHGDKLVTVTPAGVVGITNRNYDSADAFKQAMSGVYLYYQRITDETWNAPVISNVEMLNKIGTYEDVQNIVTGGVTNNVGYKVFDGTENINITNVYIKSDACNGYYIAGDMYNIHYTQSTPGYCSHFVYTKSAPIWQTVGYPNMFQFNNQQIHLNIANELLGITDYTQETIISVTTKIKAYLASEYAKGTPVIVMYPLATSATETVTAQPINQVVGTNIASISEGSLTGLVGEVSGINQTQTVPIPESPLDIVSNNGVMKYGVGKNLVQTWYTNRSRTSTNGTLYSVDKYYVSNIFPIDHTKAYTLSHDGTKIASLRVYYYSSSSEAGYISWESNVSTLTIPTNATHVAIGCGADATVSSDIEDYVKLCQAEQGSTATSYEPYFFGIHAEGTQEKITVSGKNLFDKSLYDGHGWYNNGDVIADVPSANATVVIRAIPNKTYYFKHCSVEGGGRVMYTTEENWGVGSPCESIENLSVKVQPNVVNSFTVPSDAKWVFLLAGRVDGSTTATFAEQLSDYILSEDELTADTPYEPYHVPQTALVEMLNKVGTYEDVQNIVSGGITKNVGIKVLDGTENWISLGAFDNIYRYQSSLNNVFSHLGASDNVLSSHFIYHRLQNTNGIFRISDSHYAIFCIENIPTLEDWKAYLADQCANGTPVIVVYPLATPTTETVPAQTITINKGTYKAEVTEASLSGLDISAKYLGND